ncbi:glycosyltransferase [Nostoc sp. TCL240-02]|uniref:glycosyltransferase n=1 Tax=Nostoc sp. TCL240-02 TaxID=2572090 RepID=UPI00157FB32A|nr:glycosyltransferase [Nostoc sp. TCL240-02]QKQ75875.1 glycosyltransferase family 4 protein [Nostoc sp. TCL240-02]
MPNKIKKGLFVTFSVYVNSAFGGVQRCTKEYQEVIEAAGWSLEVLAYEIDRRWQARIFRKLKPSSFYNRIPQSFIDALIAQVQSEHIPYVFLNQVDALPIAPYLKSAVPDVKIVLLSHGAQFVDDFLATQNQTSISPRKRSHLTNTILDEMQLRQHIDHVFTLSEQEIAFERWLGAKSVSWLPRIILPKPLDWRPIAGRAGFVGTLDHQPNYEGLLSILTNLQTRKDFEGTIRIVSSSKELGKYLQERFHFVKYLGRLDNEDLKNEASTWTWFIHPLFIWSRGCSTKLADALEWQIPVLTTEAGCRGYTWQKGNVIRFDAINEYSSYLCGKDSEYDISLVRQKLILASETSPSVLDVAALAKLALNKIS